MFEDGWLELAPHITSGCGVRRPETEVKGFRKPSGFQRTLQLSPQDAEPEGAKTEVDGLGNSPTTSVF